MRPSAPAAVSGESRADTQVYRPFFVCGILTVLTVGCLLGSIALLGIARQASYTAAAWTPYVLAHANSQLFGWVGFFVMGFAMQQHGTSVAKREQFHQLAWWILGTMGAGIVLRFFAEPLAQADPGRWVWLGLVSGGFQIAAVLLFLYNLGANRYRTGEPMTWPTLFVFGSLFCLVVIAFAEPFVFLQSHSPSREDSIGFVARWFTPLREVQFLGFVPLMIFGVAAAKFPGCLGFRAADSRWGIAAFSFWCAGLVARVFGWVSFFNAGMLPGTDTLFRAGGLWLAIGAVCMTVALGVFSPVRKANASQKFIVAAFGWLVIAMLLLVFEFVHLRAISAPFSHAYTGAIRHAGTVGFISQMIIGVGYHLVTRMVMADERTVPALWSVFVLLNTGNALRVGLEIATDYTSAAFAPMGGVGFVELVGIGIWAATMGRYLARRSSVYAASC